MEHLQMRIDVPESVLDLGARVRKPLEEVHEAAAEYLADLYRRFTILEGAVASGEHLFSIHVEEGLDTSAERTLYVVGSSGHSAVVEYGWTNRGQGQASYPGRFPAQQAVTFYIETLIGDWMYEELRDQMEEAGF